MSGGVRSGVRPRRRAAGGVVYAGALVLAGGLIALCVDLPRYVRRHRELQSLLDGCLYAATVLPAPRGLMEEDWRALLLCAIDQSAGQADAHDRDRRDREACIALWAHQIKVPLAAMRMLLQSEPGPASDRLTAELFKVEQYVEMLLATSASPVPRPISPCAVRRERRDARHGAPLRAPVYREKAAPELSENDPARPHG